MKSQPKEKKSRDRVLLALMLALARTITVQAPNEKLTLEVADTDATREYGLMFRTQLAPHAGMIFVFSR